MADDNKIQFDIELNEGSVESSFKVVDERAAKSAKESAAVFGEAFQKQEQDLKESIERLVKETNKVATKSAKESAAAFVSEFKKIDDATSKALRDSFDKYSKEFSANFKKSAKESASVFEEAFSKGLLQADPIQVPVEVPSSPLAIRGLADLAGGFYLLERAAMVAGTAIKATVDFIIAGEKEIKLENKFKVLATEAGLAADVLQNELRRATSGLVEDGRLLEFASESFIQLGNNAKSLPQILEAARKAYAVFGGDIVSNAEKITQAIFSGQTRQLRQIGLLVDADKVYKDYAASIGTVVPLLTEQQKQTAILNSVLEQSATRFKNVVTEEGKVTDAFTRFGVQAKELTDQLSILASNTFGKAISSIIQSVTQDLKDWNRVLAQSNADRMADGVDKLKAQIAALSDSIKAGEEKLASFNKTEMRVLGSRFVEGIAAKKKALAEYQKQLEEATKAQVKAGAAGGATPEGAGAGGGDSRADAEFLARKQALVMKVKELNGQLLASEVQLAQEEFNRKKNSSNLDALFYQQKLQAAEQYELQRSNLNTFFEQNGIVNEALRQQAREALESAHLNRLLMLNQNYQAQRQQLFIETETQALSVGESFTTMVEGMDEAAQEMSVNASKNFKMLGKTMLTSIGSAAGNAFAAFGAAIANGENALQAFGKALLNSLGHAAIQMGTTFILQGIAYSWAGLANGPALIAAGAALATFGGFLSAVGGAGPNGVVGGGGSAGGAGGFDDSSPIAESFDPEDTEAQIPRTAINLTIQGNVLDRRQTGLEIAEILEEQFADQGLVVRGA
jgi:polyhydroxyalkanoate synthesis regulator phasin